MQRVLVAGVAAAGAASLYAGGFRTRADDVLRAPSASSQAPLLDRKNARLVQVQVVFRHGARTPLTDQAHLWKGNVWDVCGCAYDPMPLELTDAKGGPRPHSPDDDKQVAARLPGNCHKGELTLLGQRQALELGLWLRQRYIDSLGFLPASYKEGVLQARTTNFSRTRATLAGVLRGLYPDDAGPVPVVTSGKMDEILYADSRTCPHLSVLMKAAAAMLQAKAEQHKTELDQLRSQLSQVMDLPAEYWSRRWQFTDLHDAFTSLNAHGKPLPAGVTPEMEMEVNKLATAEFGTFISPSLEDDHGKKILRLSMGRMLDQLLANMEAAIEGGGSTPASSSSSSSTTTTTAAAASSSHSGPSSSSTSSSRPTVSRSAPRMMFYSGHDSTIMPLLTALGVDVTLWPPYMSNLVFELWELKAPEPPPRSKMPGSSSDTTPSSSSSSSSQAASAGATAAAADAPGGQFVVRVLFNKQPIAVLDDGAGGQVVEFSHFKEQVLAPFMLSQQDHEEACHVAISHEGPLPTIISMSSAGSEE